MSTGNTTPRFFRLRNGVIVQENLNSSISFHCNGYTDRYTVVQDDKKLFTEKIMVLVVEEDTAPTGGVYGKEYDIIEEVVIKYVPISQ